MKSNKYKIVSVIIVVLAFTMQSYSPPLPNVTGVQITDLPTNYYAVQVCISGYTTVTYDNEYDYDIGPIPFNSTTYFGADHQFVHNTSTSTYVVVAVYVKQTSSSGWTGVGTMRSDNIDMTKSLSGEFLCSCSFSYDDIFNP